jgi:hypothetical protein
MGEATDSSKQKIMGLPAAHIGWIISCINIHRVAILDECGNLAWKSIRLSWPNLPNCCESIYWKQQQKKKNFSHGNKIKKISG